MGQVTPDRPGSWLASTVSVRGEGERGGGATEGDRWRSSLEVTGWRVEAHMSVATFTRAGSGNMIPRSGEIVGEIVRSGRKYGATWRTREWWQRMEWISDGRRVVENRRDPERIQTGQNANMKIGITPKTCGRERSCALREFAQGPTAIIARACIQRQSTMLNS